MRVRFRFTKHGKVRFTSHRDVARLWERALRRGSLPVALTEGFSPRPKVHFGLALSTGHESMGEYLDVDFRPDDVGGLVIEELPALLSPLLPPGLEVTLAALADRSEDSLQQAVTLCSWRIEVPDLDADHLAQEVASLLARSSVEVTRERKGKAVTDDIRPYVHLLEVADGVLYAELGTQPRGLRPGELLAAFEAPATEGLVCRTHQWISTDGARREPLAAA